jgi:hypothetical protein
MALEPEPEHSEWVRRMRERARQDAEELVPRPAFAVLGLSAPALRPAALAESQQVNGVWESITLAYGDWSAPAGPHVTVTTRLGAVSSGLEADLLRAIDSERDRLTAYTGTDEEEPAGPPRYTPQELPAGEAVICRHGELWAARLLDEDVLDDADATGVTVTITGRGIDPESVRLGPAGDLRPYLEARNEVLGQLTESRRSIPPLVLDPAQGVAALRALADHTLESNARTRAAGRARRAPRHPADWGRMQRALWQRAVSEQQRIAGTDRHAADDVVTLVINHLGHLDDQAAWFTDPGLRERAIDETLRFAMLGDDVPSKPAQQAWARYWRVSMQRWRRDSLEPEDILAAEGNDRLLAAAWRHAWAVWAQGA